MHGATLVGIAEDIDVSGEVPPRERPELGSWLRDRPDDFDTVVALKIDRVSRSLVDFATLARTYRVVTVTEGVDTGTQVGQLVAHILSMFAEFELARISDRNRESAAYLRKVGRWKGGSPPWGYRPVKDPDGPGWRLEVDPDRVDVVREVVARVIDGEAVATVAADLNRRGVAPPQARGESWGARSLLYLLRSPRLLGHTVYQERVVRGDDGKPVAFGPPLITDDTFEQLQAALDVRSITRTRTAGAGYLLNIGYCAVCGSPLYTQRRAHRNREYVYLQCSRAMRSDECDAARMREWPVRAFANAAFRYAVGPAAETRKVRVPASDVTAELARARRSLEELRTERRNGEYDYPGGDADYEATRTQLVGEVKRLGAMPQRPARDEYVPTGRTYETAWQSDDTDEAHRALLLRAGVRVYVQRHPVDKSMIYARLYVPPGMAGTTTDTDVPLYDRFADGVPELTQPWEVLLGRQGAPGMDGAEPV